MCSKCYKEANKSENNKSGADVKSSTISTATPTTESSQSPSISHKDDTHSTPATDGASSQEQPISRKHARSPSPIATKDERDSSLLQPPLSTHLNTSSQIAESMPSSSASTPTTLVSTPSTAVSTPTTTTTTTTTTTERPQQLNKGRCFRCRVKVPLAKQTINKCRCEYVFCDSHRYPDRHDCEVDFAKLDRDTLAKNNPKLHERPKGGRSFQRIDSL
ncbi:hypothetical protein BDA99DRAFT_538236 [Phascolomyces articulosus]|uniref:AN1-type domain-containing protein n=1 Tax=Phascolomyces articulosus TaxID=60185 RepID=A0AAD5JYL6_9FUNG|nr:hypothetical protein BDA99DRAFT_538236 [Phascolomyces articulosus]